MTPHGGMVTLTGGEMPPEKGERGDDVSWADTNFTEPKTKKIHAVNSAATNRR
jgi:hypothetical protein